jgi:hypothetical protein
MYSRNKKLEIKKKNYTNYQGNKICWVAVILVGWSERGNKQNFNLGLMSVTPKIKSATD